MINYSVKNYFFVENTALYKTFVIFNFLPFVHLFFTTQVFNAVFFL